MTLTETAGAPALLLLSSGAALTAAACWGAGDFCGGLATKKTSPFAVIAIAHALDIALLGGWLLFAHGGPPLHEALVWGTLSGLINGGALSCFYLALAGGAMGVSASLAGLLTAIIPVIVEMVERGVPPPAVICGFVLALAAIVLLTREEHTAQKVPLKTIALATVAGVGFGLFLVFSRQGSQHQLVWPLLLSRAGSTTVALAGLMVWRGRGRSRGRLGARSLKLAAVAGIMDAAGNLLFMWAARAGRLDVAAVLASLYPAGTILLAMLVLREKLGRAQAWGVGVALVAVALISFAA